MIADAAAVPSRLHHDPPGGVVRDLPDLGHHRHRLLAQSAPQRRRTLGRHREARHELDVALRLVRATGTFNVLLEFLEYDRSIVLDALGDPAAARASYRRYLQLVNSGNRRAASGTAGPQPVTARRPLEPFLLKRADRFVLEHLDEPFSMALLGTNYIYLFSFV